MRKLKRASPLVAAAIPAIAACGLLVGEPHGSPLPPADPTCCDQACPIQAITEGAYVAPYGSGEACTRDAPCASVEKAIQKLNGPGVVLVASGVYRETVHLGNASSIAVCGGYDPSNGWKRSDAGTTLTSEDARTIDNGGGPACVILDGLEIATRAANPGETVYGVFASRGVGATTMCLRDITLDVAPGGDGDAGAAGADGGSNPCDAGGTGDDGKDGDNAGPTTAAGLATDGQFHRQDGQNGKGGEPGQSGNFVPALCVADESGDPFLVCVNSPNECPKVDAATQIPCNVGRPSCGGPAGGGGWGGVGGGASIGLVAVRVHVSALRLRVTTKQGGAGGASGQGGAGGSPTMGVREHCSYCDVTTPNQHKFFDAGTLDAAIIDAGGRGGNGGAGSGGAGGWSCGVVIDEATDVGALLDAGTILVGAPGMGGSGAPNGQSKRVCFLDGGGIE